MSTLKLFLMNPNNPGRLVVIEGTNLAGKSSFTPQFKLLLESLGYKVTTTFEPGGTVFGAHMRAGLKTTEGVCDFARALAMNASRAQKQVEITRPAIQRGEIVLSDRYSTSTRVFQQELGTLTPEEYALVEAIHHALIQPDLTIYLLPTVELLLKRKLTAKRDGEKDVFEKNIVAELAAYERVLNRELALGLRIAVLRYGEEKQNELLSMLVETPAFKEVFATAQRFGA